MGKLLVIVDNVEPVRTMLRQLVEDFYQDRVKRGELHIEALADGESVCALCGTRTPDLILMDVDMPVQDGIQAFYALREANPLAARRVLFLTGLAGSREVGARMEQAIRDGACGFIPKPATAAEIKAAIELRLYGP